LKEYEYSEAPVLFDIVLRDGWKIIVIMIIAVLVSSMISGYLFSTLTHNMGVTSRLPGLEYRPSIEYEVKVLNLDMSSDAHI
jgi:hypothetical protein